MRQSDRFLSRAQSAVRDGDIKRANKAARRAVKAQRIESAKSRKERD